MLSINIMLFGFLWMQFAEEGIFNADAKLNLGLYKISMILYESLRRLIIALTDSFVDTVLYPENMIHSTDVKVDIVLVYDEPHLSGSIF